MLRSQIILALVVIAGIPAAAQTAPPAALAEIQAFNQKLGDATRAMDNAATLALWADDGISLLPSTAPITGKPAIAAFLEKMTASIPGAKMDKFELRCFAIDVSGDLATEWCTEHQIVKMADGKPPFDGRGKMLLVLRRAQSRNWLLEREMWNEANAD